MSLRLQGFIQLLKIRDYALLWMAQLISVIGDWVLTAALLIFVYKLTGQKLTLGKMLVFEAAPVILFGYPAGALADFLNRRRLMIACDLLRAGAVLPLLFVRDAGDIWMVYLAGFSIGFFSLFFRPARIASIPNVVPKHLLVTANSAATLNETIGMLVGPVIGAALAFSFIRIVCLLDAASFILSALALWLAVIPQGPRAVHLKRARDLWVGLGTSLRFMASNATIRSLMIVLGLVAIAVGAYNVLEVAFAKDDLGLTDAQFGLLIAFLALGMFLGLIACNALAKQAHPVTLTAGGIVLFGASLIGFSMTGGLYPALGVLVMMGMGNAAALIGCTTMFQIYTPNEIQGRIVSLFWVVYTALNCVAMYGASWATDQLGVEVRPVLLGAGILATVSGIVGVPLLAESRRTYSMYSDAVTEEEPVILGSDGGD